MLTKRRKEILDFIISFRDSTGQIPTIREICNHFGFRSTNGVYEHLKSLEKDGYLELKQKKSRGICIKDEKQNFLPLLGVVPAGSPLYPIIEEGEHVNMPLKHKEGFLLRVKGDSMIKAGIQDGDIVLVEANKEVTNNSIVVAMIEEEVTLKRLFIYNDFIELRPENDNYKPIKVNKRQIKILGRVTTLIRKL
ncbi:MAG: transcriptional repressor LexA [Proteobacteria bacterium]|nr:transcriptional repressor LexA [Pseudomonadota bacterium]